MMTEGGSTSTPAAETGEQDFDPRRADGGGAAAEMDRNGAGEGSGVGDLNGRVHPAGWTTKTRSQKRGYWRRRRK